MVKTNTRSVALLEAGGGCKERQAKSVIINAKSVEKKLAGSGAEIHPKSGPGQFFYSLLTVLQAVSALFS